jgi:hypothetical protein
MRAYLASFSEDPEAAEYIKIAMAYPGTQAMGLFGSASPHAQRNPSFAKLNDYCPSRLAVHRIVLFFLSFTQREPKYELKWKPFEPL